MQPPRSDGKGAKMTNEERELLTGFLKKAIEAADEAIAHYSFVLEDIENAPKSDRIQAGKYLTAMREEWAGSRARSVSKLERLEAGEEVDIFDDGEGENVAADTESAPDPKKTELYKAVADEIQQKEAFGLYDGSMYGLTYISSGVRMLAARSEDFRHELEEIAQRFKYGDLGEWDSLEDKEMSKSLKKRGREEGTYKTSFGRIDIKRNVTDTTAYMPFER